jgi:hypothetical protein
LWKLKFFSIKSKNVRKYFWVGIRVGLRKRVCIQELKYLIIIFLALGCFEDFPIALKTYLQPAAVF